MKALTIALDEALLRRANEFAGSRGVPVERLIQEALEEKLRDTAPAWDFFRLAETLEHTPSHGAWRREDLYARGPMKS